jgi:hypothetical protein
VTIDDTIKEIQQITTRMIEVGLSIDEKWPSQKGSRISWEGQTDISSSLKNIPYEEKYKIVEKERNYNFRMIDGALVQFMYEFDATGKDLIAHRLAFFPSPHLERYDDLPERYEEDFSYDSEFHDMLEKNIVAFPVRFDFSKHFVAVEHPYSHVTFGEYQFCRIPASSPVTPSLFINFLLRNFYNCAIRVKGDIFPQPAFRFPLTIVEVEQKIIHFNYN